MNSAYMTHMTRHVVVLELARPCCIPSAVEIPLSRFTDVDRSTLQLQLSPLSPLLVQLHLYYYHVYVLRSQERNPVCIKPHANTREPVPTGRTMPASCNAAKRLNSIRSCAVVSLRTWLDEWTGVLTQPFAAMKLMVTGRNSVCPVMVEL